MARLPVQAKTHSRKALRFPSPPPREPRGDQPLAYPLHTGQVWTHSPQLQLWPDTDLGPLPPDRGARGALIVQRVIGGREVGVLEEHLPPQTGPLQGRIVLVLVGLHTREHGGRCPSRGGRHKAAESEAGTWVAPEVPGTTGG